jgi:hypothetical protein
MKNDKTFHDAIVTAAAMCERKYMTCPTAIGAIMFVAKSIERQVEFIPFEEISIVKKRIQHFCRSNYLVSDLRASV